MQDTGTATIATSKNMTTLTVLTIDIETHYRERIPLKCSCIFYILKIFWQLIPQITTFKSIASEP